jgi:hypothetical protein
MYDTKFLTAVAERAIKTFAQTLLATIGADSAGVLDATTVDAAKVAAGATLLSILTSFASSVTGNPGPSLPGETTDLGSDVDFTLPTPVTASTASKTTTNAAAAKATVKATPAKKPAAKKPAAKKTEQ